MKNTYSFSSIEGKIELLLVCYKERDAYTTWPFIKELAKKTAAHTRLLIWTNSTQQQNLIAEKLEQEGIATSKTFTPTGSEKCMVIGNGAQSDFTEWVRDPFFAANQQPGSPIYLLKSNMEEYINGFDRYFADELARIKVVTGPVGDFQHCYLEGGNVLWHREHLFIGLNNLHFIKNTRQTRGYRNSIQDFLAGFLQPAKGNLNLVSVGFADLEDGGVYRDGSVSRERGIDPYALFDLDLWYGTVRSSTYVPKAHIDLFMSVTGAEIDERPLLLIADPVCDYAEYAQPAQNLKSAMDQVVGIMENKGFAVKRNPMPLIPNPPGLHYFGAYNNCLVEWTDGDYKRVYLPHFAYGQFAESLVTYENQNEKIWGDLGFEVIFIHGDFQKIAPNGGSLHCLTNDLKRKV